MFHSDAQSTIRYYPIKGIPVSRKCISGEAGTGGGGGGEREREREIIDLAFVCVMCLLLAADIFPPPYAVCSVEAPSVPS